MKQDFRVKQGLLNKLILPRITCDWGHTKNFPSSGIFSFQGLTV